MSINRITYNGSQIAKIESLASLLQTTKTELINISNDIESHYLKPFTVEKNGKSRVIHEPKPHLKSLQRRINKLILSNVNYPSYLQGGIEDKNDPRDYFNNAKKHTNQKWIITMDIQDFYPSIRFDSIVRIFKYLFKYSHEVSNCLAKLVTYPFNNDRYLPQGGVTSTYIANLIFFDTEPNLFQYFKSRHIQYTRLLDDITISSAKDINSKKTAYCKRIIALIKPHNLKINKQKTKFVHANDKEKKLIVNNLLVHNKIPRCTPADIDDTRIKVRNCLKDFNANLENRFQNLYHENWNHASGKVAKITRSQQGQATKLRKSLNLCLPEYKNSQINNIKDRVDFIYHEYLKNNHIAKKYSFIKKINYLYYQCNIISRSDQQMAKRLRRKLSLIPIIKKELTES